MQKKSVARLVVAAMCLALCLVLPFLTGQIREIGSMLCPMHLPVLLCGFLCGWPWGLAVGAVAPLLRSALFGMPPLFPIAVSMAAELAVYGLVTGLLSARLPKKLGWTYVSLIAAMLLGRVAWGLVRLLLAGLSGGAFTWAMFLSGALTTAIPGIIVQLILVPVIVTAVQKRV
ncbi:MAG: ECF transporter S component [Clostridiales bacterium]|nr:ECF transporter S component [Clostridiales bacterium]